MENPIKSYKDLLVWQKGIELVSLIYKFTQDFPREELYGLKSQMRRASVSIPSNTAEGKIRGTRKDYRQFIITALASSAELETQLVVSEKLNFGNPELRLKLFGILTEEMRMLSKLTSSLKMKPNTRHLETNTSL